MLRLLKASLALLGSASHCPVGTKRPEPCGHGHGFILYDALAQDHP